MINYYCGLVLIPLYSFFFIVLSLYRLTGVDPHPPNKPTAKIAATDIHLAITSPLLFLYASTESGLHSLQSLLLCNPVCIIKILS